MKAISAKKGMYFVCPKNDIPQFIQQPTLFDLIFRRKNIPLQGVITYVNHNYNGSRIYYEGVHVLVGHQVECIWESEERFKAETL
jgi:hypothetical protein